MEKKKRQKEKKKLILAKETVRDLGGEDLKQVAAGANIFAPSIGGTIETGC